MADYRPITPASENKLAELWKRFTQTEIPMGDYEYGLGVKVNDVLRPVTDKRADPDMLPKTFRLDQVPGFLSHMAEGYDVKKMGQGIVDAIQNGPDPNEPYGAIKHLFRLLPMLGVIGHSAPFAPAAEAGSTTLGTYAGRKSATADLGALERAERMERAGESAAPDGRIRQHTGWFKEPGGDWQYEISDQDSFVTLHPADANQYTMVHPKLFEAYPDLENMPVHRLRQDTDVKGWYGRGGMSPDDGEIGLRGGMTSAELRSTGLHEFNHAVQDIEGFPVGAMPYKADPREVAWVENRIRELDKKEAFDGLTDAEKREHQTVINQLDGIKLAEQNAIHDYRRTLGEFSSRDVQAREDYPDWKRQAVPPYSSEKVDDLIIRRDRPKGERSASADPGGVNPPGPEGEPPVAPISLDEVAPIRTPLDEVTAGGPAATKGDIADPLSTAAPRADRPPVQHEGRDLAHWTPQDFEAYGKQHGVADLGPLTPPTRITDLDGREFEIPGGTDGKFTYYDLLHMKAQGINADRLRPEDHLAIQHKMSRTMTPDEVSDAHVFNGLLFGITSPNQPLLPNQMAQSLLKVSSLEDIDKLGEMIPWRAGEKVPKDVRQQYDRQLAEHFGVQAGERGGLGIKGSADYTRIAEMAQLFRQKPEWFRLQPGEDWADLVDRISSQVTGLGTKTGSFSSVWQNPAGAQVSAMDRHMAQRFFDRMYAGKAERKEIEKSLASKWNEHVDRRRELEKQYKRKEVSDDEYDRKTKNIAAGEGSKKVRTLQDILAQSGGDGFFTDQMLNRMGSGEKKLMTQVGRGPDATQQKNPSLSQVLRDTDWILQPEKVQTASPLYKRALEINAEDAGQQGLSLFMSQWLGWDKQRKRFEPHENMFPGTEKLPRPSQEQLQRTLDAHRATGHLDYTKEDQLNAKGELEQRLRPTRPTDNPAGLAFFSQAPVPKGGGEDDPAVKAAVAAWLRRQGSL